MAGINGNVEWQWKPVFINDNGQSAFPVNRFNFLKSANEEIRYQAIWNFTPTGKAAITEGIEASSSNWTGTNGDVVNVIFKVESSIDSVTYETIATIRKSRDVSSKRYNTNSEPQGHRFTVDVSQLLQDELSYSLCPINKGTWQSNYYGGMNGGLTVSDNVLGNLSAAGSPVSQYNVSKNGTYRLIRISTSYEVVNGDGEIISATGGGLTSAIIGIINSVNQFERDDVYYNQSYFFDANATIKYKFLSRCPNEVSSSGDSDIKKQVRIDNEAEWLQFYIRRSVSTNIGSSSDLVGAMGLKIETFTSNGSAENTFYVRDFEDNLITENTGSGVYFKDYQNSMFVQNISPYYINNTASLKSSTTSRTTFPYWTAYSGNKITSSTAYYRVSLSRFAFASAYGERRTSEYRYYSIDREDDKIPYNFVRFHWLNSMGGIDSYTAKRNISEGLTISRDVVERKSVDRTWYQDDQDINGVAIPTGAYISDTMRGGDLYKGGREVTNVNAEKNRSVYTEPLNSASSKWLKEIMLSPNVWIEMDTEATQMGNARNPYLRPSTKGYIPVIITNSDIETVNQEQGLVRFNIEYVLSHKVITQRN